VLDGITFHIEWHATFYALRSLSSPANTVLGSLTLLVIPSIFLHNFITFLAVTGAKPRGQPKFVTVLLFEMKDDLDCLFE